VATQQYRGHLISVSAILDTLNKHHFTPVTEARSGISDEILTTILTPHAFHFQDRAIEYGFILGQEWIDKRLSESPE
jgi:hypothetical protein